MTMKSFIRKACFVLASALCTVAFTACENDDTAGGDLQLYYPTVIDIGPSMNYLSGAPSYHGPTPSEFVIERITCNDQQVETACFSIEAANGAVSIADTDELPTGTYKLSISCRAGGSKFRFSDIFVVQMVAAAPAELEVSEPTFDIPFDELETTEMAVTVTPVGETVSILSYALEQEEGREYFAISNKGVVTLNADFKGKILPGTYPLPICITTRAGKYTYENLLTVRITSAPLEIAYPVASGRMEVDHAFVSTGAPTMKGSPEQTVWAIEKITPSEGVGATDKIVIDSATGVISVEENSGLPLDAVYTLDLRVTNEFGSKVFEGAYTLTVIAYIEPIDPETFGYTAKEVIEGTAFSVEPNAGIVGDELTYAFGELPAELAGQIEISPATGAISSVGKLSAAQGEYSIPVKIENTKSSAETTFVLKVTENPNMFKLFRYGNNMNIEDWENNADQFIFDMTGTSKDDSVVDIPLGHDDFDGRDVSFKMSYVHNNPIRTASSKSYIDSSNGTLHLTFRNDRAGQFGVVRVDATIGTGETAVTKTTYVFVKIQTDVDKAVVYKPMVFRVNPMKGGRSEAPILTGIDPAQFMITLKRNIFYYNFNGPASHISNSAALSGSSDKNSFIYRIWESYFGVNGVEAGSREPMSYYSTKDASKATNLDAKFGYLDGDSGFSMYIPGGKWRLDNEWANGILIFQAPYTKTATYGDLDKSSASDFIYMAVWFDENF